MTTTTAKPANIKTCSRCKGKGIVNSPVVHCGAPGTCYKCDGIGKTRHFTMKERVETFISRCEAHLTELTERAAEMKAAAAARKPSKVEGVNRSRAARLERSLEMLRHGYKKTRAQLNAARKTGKVTAEQQPSHQPAR